ncbi:nucleotidyltransferase-like protein [Paenibacillus crassostreae]|uniref:Nucleotidyltransferase-like domain-containing protein n=1 Tax=Paenibacillus crassostreae TaxID=1763538 RepID=A0A167ESB0_9BACL|nr:nucleotidyltransferase-like protein [Paenibacillus crassostreae]OAB75835.1 hypothetical protein PNBC_07300 [Paenibacillus crassostreae]
MESTKLIEHYKDALDENSIGAFVYEHRDSKFQGSFFRDFDILLLVIQESEQSCEMINHIMYEDKRCQLLRINYMELRGMLVAGEKRDLVRCVFEGQIISDMDGRLTNIRLEFQEFKQPLRDQKMFFEFSKFLCLYLEAKRYMSEGYIMDAYHSVTDSLHHWAQIELVERGIRPELNVWEQVRGLNTAVHKLYNELTVSKESVEQRVELVLLGCEFSVLSKMAECSNLLIKVMGSRNKPWSIEELIRHPQLEMVSSELPLVLRKLVYRSIIKEVMNVSVGGNDRKQAILYSTI